MRGIFFDEGEARQAALSLVRGGFTAEVSRERLHGEDDDEGHPWAVITDAPETVLELLVESFDGWLDREEPEPTKVDLPPTPVALPDQPKRIKRP